MRMEEVNFREMLNQRLTPREGGRIDVRSKLKHFALINYALPKSRLEPHIPVSRFEIPEFVIKGKRLALMSAVPFLDVDFRFGRLLPFLKFSFAQTNYRVYVIDKKSGAHVVWFFGTTLGSRVVQISRRLWKIPWHYARYQVECRYDQQARRYASYEYAAQSQWSSADISLEDTGEPVRGAEGFGSLDELKLVLTHPVDGYFRRLDGTLGGYSVWHEEISVTSARPKHLYLYSQPKIDKELFMKPSQVFASLCLLLLTSAVCQAQLFSERGGFLYSLNSDNQVFDVAPNGSMAVSLMNDPAAVHPALLTVFNPVTGERFDSQTFGFGPLGVKLAQTANGLRAVVLTSQGGPRAIYLFDISSTGKLTQLSMTQLTTSGNDTGSNIVLSSGAQASRRYGKRNDCLRSRNLGKSH